MTQSGHYGDARAVRTHRPRGKTSRSLRCLSSANPRQNRVAAQWGEGDPFKVQGSRSIIIATYVGMHDHSTPRSYHTTGMVDAPGTVDYGISVSTVDNHGCHESGDG